MSAASRKPTAAQRIDALEGSLAEILAAVQGTANAATAPEKQTAKAKDNTKRTAAKGTRVVIPSHTDRANGYAVSVDAKYKNGGAGYATFELLKQDGSVRKATRLPIPALNAFVDDVNAGGACADVLGFTWPEVG